MAGPTDPELWTVADIAAHFGVKAASARGWLTRHGVKRAATGESASGRITALYRATDIREAAASAPGRGHRTDLDGTEA
jgi:transposase-like protein